MTSTYQSKTLVARADEILSHKCKLLNRRPRLADKVAIRDCIVQCLEDGFTEDEAWRTARCTEHWDPRRSEASALAEMKRISDKVEAEGRMTAFGRARRGKQKD